jgi:hypothetical protein
MRLVVAADQKARVSKLSYGDIKDWRIKLKWYFLRMKKLFLGKKALLFATIPRRNGGDCKTRSFVAACFLEKEVPGGMENKGEKGGQ